MDVLLAGDFNATSPSWLSTDSHNAAGLLLEQAFLQLGLTQHVFQPTHLRVNGGLGSTLDLILSSSPGCVSNVASTSPLGKSDHCVLYASVDFRPSRQSAHSRLRRLWAYDKADFGDINKRLLKADWPSFSTLSVDQAWIAWKKEFLDIVSKHVPSKLVASPRPHVPWMTDTLRQMIKDKRAAFRKFKSHPSAESCLCFCTQQSD